MLTMFAEYTRLKSRFPQALFHILSDIDNRRPQKHGRHFKVQFCEFTLRIAKQLKSAHQLSISILVNHRLMVHPRHTSDCYFA